MGFMTRREALNLLAGSLTSIAAMGIAGCSGGSSGDSQSGNDGTAGASSSSNDSFGITSNKPITLREAFTEYDAYWFFIHFSDPAELLSKRSIATYVFHFINGDDELYASSVRLGDVAAAKDESELHALLEAGLVANDEVTKAGDPEGWDSAKPFFGLLSADILDPTNAALVNEYWERSAMPCVGVSNSGDYKTFTSINANEAVPVTEIEGKFFAGFSDFGANVLLTLVNEDFPGFELDQPGTEGVEDLRFLKTLEEFNEKVTELGY